MTDRPAHLEVCCLGVDMIQEAAVLLVLPTHFVLCRVFFPWDDGRAVLYENWYRPAMSSRWRLNNLYLRKKYKLFFMISVSMCICIVQ